MESVKALAQTIQRIEGAYAPATIRAYAVNADQLQKMVSATDDSLRDIRRDRAILLLAYDSLRRRS